MVRFEIIPYRFYLNHITGKKASIFSSYLGEDREIVESGFTIRDNYTGTTGQGKPPAKTMEEAIERLAGLNQLYGVK